MHIFFLIYMLKTALCLSVFYLFYRFWLSKETFHRFNRMVLIGLILVAFVIPSLKVSQNFHLPQIEQVFERLNIPEEETEQEHDLQKMEQVTTTTLHTQLEKERSDFTILTLGNLGFLYLGGALLLLLRYIFSIACIYRLIRNSEKKCWKRKIRLVVHQQNAAIARTKDDSRRKGTPAMMALRRFVRIADSTAIQQLARFLRYLLQRLRIMGDGSGVGKAAFKESMAT